MPHEMEAVVRRFRAERRALDALAEATAYTTICNVCGRRMRFVAAFQELQVCCHVMEALRRHASPTPALPTSVTRASPVSVPFDLPLCGMHVVAVPSEKLPLPKPLPLCPSAPLTLLSES